MSVKVKGDGLFGNGYGNNDFINLPTPNVTPQEGFDTLMGQNLDFDYITGGQSTITNKPILYFQVFSETAKISAIERKKNGEWISTDSIYANFDLEMDRGFYGEHRNITVSEGTILVYYSKN